MPDPRDGHSARQFAADFQKHARRRAMVKRIGRPALLRDGSAAGVLHKQVRRDAYLLDLAAILRGFESAQGEERELYAR